MRNIFASLLLIFGICNSIAAQQAPHYTQFMFNHLAYNPAYAGSKDAMTFMALYRHQWQGIDGAPRTMNLHMHTPFLNNKCGAGLSIVGDRIGMMEVINISGHYSYKLKFGEKSVLNIGLTGRLGFSSLNWDEADPIDLGDTGIPLSEEKHINPNFGFGLYYNAPKYYLGFSIPTLLKRRTLGENFGGESVHSFRDYYFLAGILARVSRNVDFRPSVLMTFNPNAPFEMDLNGSLVFFETLWVGLTYRLGDSFDMVFNYQINQQLKAGIGVDMTMSKLNNFTRGSWEVMVEYTMKYEGEKLNNLRFF